MSEIIAFFGSAISSAVGSLVYEVSKHLVLTKATGAEEKKLQIKLRRFCDSCEEYIIDFLDSENVEEERGQRLIEEIKSELMTYARQPEIFVNEKLNGERLYERSFPNAKAIPKAIVEDGTRALFEKLFIYVAEHLAGISLLIEKNRNQATMSILTQVDELLDRQRSMSEAIIEIAERVDKRDKSLMMRARQHILEKSAYRSIDLIGLSSKNILLKGSVDSFFVAPRISMIQPTGRKATRNEDEILSEISAVSAEILVVAAAGAGKTTWSRYIERQVAKIASSRRLPIRRALRRIDWGRVPSWRELVFQSLEQNQRDDLTEDTLSDWRDHGDIVFIFDGLDEAPIESRDRAIEFFRSIRESNPICPIIVTSRHLTTDHLSKFGESIWRIEPLNRVEMLEYVNNWKDNHSSLEDGKMIDDAEEFVDQILSEQSVKALAEVPLLLNTILAMHHIDGFIPSSKGALYNRYVNGMIRVWPERKSVKIFENTLSTSMQYDLLQRVALFMQLNERDSLPGTDAEGTVARALHDLRVKGEPSEILQAIKERTGLIEWPGTFDFVHKSIAEYLTADAVRRGNCFSPTGETIDRAWLRRTVSNASSGVNIGSRLDRWLNVLSFWGEIAGEGDVMAFINQLMDDTQFHAALQLWSDRIAHVEPAMRESIWKDWFRRGEIFGERVEGAGPWRSRRPTVFKLDGLSAIGKGYPDEFVSKCFGAGLLPLSLLAHSQVLPSWILVGLRAIMAEYKELQEIYVNHALDGDLWLGSEYIEHTSHDNCSLSGRAYIWSRWKLLEETRRFAVASLKSKDIAHSNYLRSDKILDPSGDAMAASYFWYGGESVQSAPVDLLDETLKAFLSCRDVQWAEEPDWWKSEFGRVGNIIRKRSKLSCEKPDFDRAYRRLTELD